MVNGTRRESGKAMRMLGAGAGVCFRHAAPRILAHDYVRAVWLWGTPSAGIGTVRPTGLGGGGTG